MISKTASIIDTTDNFDFLSDMFQFIFGKVYEVDKVNKISIELSDIPKEVTCKGGFYIDEDLNINRHKELVEFSIKNSPMSFS